MKILSNNKRSQILFIALIFAPVIIAAFIAGSVIHDNARALSTNSDLTVTETEDGYAIHEPKSDWVYGRDPYIELVPYDENNGMDPATPDVNTPSPDADIDNGSCAPPSSTITDNLSVVDGTFDSETGTVTYTCLDYITSREFTITLGSQGLVSISIK